MLEPSKEDLEKAHKLVTDYFCFHEKDLMRNGESNDYWIQKQTQDIAQALAEIRAEGERKRSEETHTWSGCVHGYDTRIKMPCPSCGSRSLFIGSGGHITCGYIPCKKPLLSEHIRDIIEERQSWEREKAELVNEYQRLQDKGLAKFSKETPQDLVVLKGDDMAKILAEKSALEAELKKAEGAIRTHADSINALMKEKAGLESGRLSIKIDFVGPAAIHNLLCWICHKEPAVYDMNPNWYFRPCWNCQREIKNAIQ